MKLIYNYNILKSNIKLFRNYGGNKNHDNRCALYINDDHLENIIWFEILKIILKILTILANFWKS